MDKTPIQELIEMFDIYEDTETFTIEGIVRALEAKLPAERKFAETCFDAGSEFMHNFPKPNAISFDNFYNQYTHD